MLSSLLVSLLRKYLCARVCDGVVRCRLLGLVQRCESAVGQLCGASAWGQDAGCRGGVVGRVRRTPPQGRAKSCFQGLRRDHLSSPALGPSVCPTWRQPKGSPHPGARHLQNTLRHLSGIRNGSWYQTCLLQAFLRPISPQLHAYMVISPRLQACQTQSPFSPKAR